MVKRRGGGLPVGEGRVGVPLTERPSAVWAEALRRALGQQRPDDERWQHAAQTASVDEAAGVPHILLLTSGIEDADFLVSYLQAIDAAIDVANREVA
jgi:hypothetical protein